MRRLLIALAVLALLAVAVFVAAALALDPASLREPLAALASERLERPVELGEMQLDLFPVPAVHVAEVRVGAERPTDPPLAEVAEILGHSTLEVTRRHTLTAPLKWPGH